MSELEIFAFAGIVLIAVLGLLGRRKPTVDMAEWTVGGRKFGAFTMWFLQAGEIFTTFTFLGMAGLAFSGGVAATYALPYVPIGYTFVFFLSRRLWRLGRERGYLTQGDFLADRYDSKLLGTVAAVVGVICVVPYLDLQITGLGLIVKLVTGNATSSTLSMVVGCLLMVAFVLWSGMRGVASSSYFKDVMMLVVLLILVVAVPVSVAGGISGVFDKVQRLHAASLLVHSGPNNEIWYLSSMFLSLIGVAFLTLPHTWPAILSARSPKVLRRNYVWMPLYELLLMIPMIIGFAAILVLNPTTVKQTSGVNGVLLTLSKHALPGWVLGLVVVGAIATAMVPGASLLIGISSLVSRNIVRAAAPRRQFWINQGSVVVACGLALALGLTSPSLLTNLLLLTYSGTVQLAPAIGLGFLRTVPIGKVPMLAGIIAGEIVVLLLTFGWTTLTGTFSVGLVGLAVNLVVLGVAALLERAGGRSREAVTG